MSRRKPEEIRDEIGVVKTGVRLYLKEAVVPNFVTQECLRGIQRTIFDKGWSDQFSSRSLGRIAECRAILITFWRFLVGFQVTNCGPFTRPCGFLEENLK